MNKNILILLLGIVYLLACRGDQYIFDDTLVDLGYSDEWPEPYIHPDNQLQAVRTELGRHLFYDKRLSRDSSISCNSCHLQSNAFSDTLAISPGVEGRTGFRNAPSLMNLSFVDRAHKDGGVQSIDLQAITPIEDHNEMDLSLVHAVQRIKNDSLYQTLAQAGYQRGIDNYTVVFSLGNFVKSLVSKESKFDAVQQGQSSFTSLENQGYQLFKENCSTCHTPPWFASNAYLNNGTKLDYSKDQGRMRVSMDSLDLGKFRVPSLRNIELTYPYMHDGSFKSLDSVLAHYAKGGQAHYNRDSRVATITLTKDDQSALKAFLQTLTDPSISKNPNYSKPKTVFSE
jgi:cytochrome c peroxidase